MTRSIFAAAIAAVLTAGPVLAQQAGAAPAPAPPPADPADVSTVDGIMRAVYDVISGDSTQPRNWNRFRSLFAPGARLIPSGRRQGGAYGFRMITPEEYVTMGTTMFARQPFFERELARRTETYGPLVHLFSTYESSRTPGGPAFDRGINSFQLHWDGTRWWVVTIYWFSEAGGTPIPARYLTTENN